MFQLLVFCACLVFVLGGLFDVADLDDPLTFLWNLPIQQKLSQCTIDADRKGVCIDKAKCILSGGTPIGHCGVFFSCCSYDTNCVRISEKKQATFSSGNLNSATTNCRYTIKLRNKNVCQVRLDFVELILAPAILTSSSTQEGSYSIFSCANDSLRISPNNFGVPVICGNSTQQHVYVHVNQTTDPNDAVSIDITIANRLKSENQYLPNPSWKIKFTQLECPLKRKKFEISRFGNVDDINNDYNVLAPHGAVQYFTNTHGEIRSFGFNTTEPKVSTEMVSYPYLEHYTIAFRRPTDVCGIKFTPVTFNLLAEGTSDVDTCLHYLNIPEYYSESSNQVGESSTGVCTGTNSFYSLSPGPLYINFKSMHVSSETTQQTTHQGFLINYELSASCPYNIN